MHHSVDVRGVVCHLLHSPTPARAHSPQIFTAGKVEVTQLTSMQMRARGGAYFQYLLLELANTRKYTKCTK